MNKLLTAALLVVCSVSFSQNFNSLWKSSSITNSNSKNINKTELPLKHLFNLDVNTLKDKLASAPKRDAKASSNTVISLPNGDGKLENFRVYENSVMDPGLAAKYPEIKSYVAVGIDNPNARAYFSNSPLGFKSMTLYAGEAAVFIEPISADLKTYTAYKKSDKKKNNDPFECNTIDLVDNNIQKTKPHSAVARYAADDGKLRTFRLALSCTAEYAAYFGGTKAGALAAMNNTLTRINGIFENDFGVQLILVAKNDDVIYTNALTDPYSDTTSKFNWRSEIQSNLNTTIGLANYDIGHLLSAGTGNFGDAGGIGTVCSDFNKGSGYTCAYAGAYQGDAFDVEYVAHEIGHQLGAYHTFTYKSEAGTGAQMEPGDGSTIMSYGGLTMKAFQNNPDAYFHAISIQQVTDKVKSKTCPVIISTGNAVPVVNAGLDYNIPKGTPVMLMGSATDANNDVLTYTWEQMDLGDATSSVPNATSTAGPLFRSYTPSTSPTRYLPNMTTILTGSTTTLGTYIPSEVLPGVARNLNFRLTVRDNRAGGPTNNTDDMVITVDGNSGPFTVDSQNTAVSYTAQTTQTINWTVAGTNANGVNCTAVDILLSTDGGKTFPITLLTATPNTGSANVVIPNILGTTNRIMVKGNNQIFFDVNNSNFIITSFGSADTIAPTASTLSASGITTSGTNLSWTAATDNLGVAGYNLYQNGVLKTTTTNSTFTVSDLSASTAYSFYVVAKDAAGNLSSASNTENVTTLSATDTLAPSASTLSASGITTSSTNLSWTAATDNIGVAGYNLYQNGVLKTTTTNTTFTVSDLSASTAYSFYAVAKDAAGNLSAVSNAVNLTTLSSVTTPEASIALVYCSSYGTNTSKEFINKVQIGSIINISGNNNGYGNFTGMSTDLAIGSSNAIVITPTWTGTYLYEAYRVWIDFNQDGDFNDSGELAYSKPKTKSKSKSVTGYLSIPTTAITGSTRMRVSMKNNLLPNPCEIISYGEVEDYTVNITGLTARPENTEVAAVNIAEEKLKDTKRSLIVYPNPVKGDVLNILNLEKLSNFRIFNLIGQELSSNHIENNGVYVGNLKAGVYLIEVTDGISSTTKPFIKE